LIEEFISFLSGFLLKWMIHARTFHCLFTLIIVNMMITQTKLFI